MNQMFVGGAFGLSQIGNAEIGPGSMELFEQAAPLVSLGAFSCDLATGRLAWTDGVFEMFGVPKDHAPDRQEIVEFYSEESRQLLEKMRAQAIANRSRFSLDASILRPDGGRRRIRITAATSCSNGRAVGLYGMKQDITQDHERWESLRKQAECDPLTGVANRARFQSFLEQRKGAPALDSNGALILFDLDGFKQINDWWGHAAGDACLVAFGQRLRTAFPQALLISRIGGDEFAVLLPSMGSRRQTEAAVRSVLGNLLSPVPCNGTMLPLNVSVGLAFVSAETAATPQHLFTRADEALYDAKRCASTVLVCT